MATTRRISIAKPAIGESEWQAIRDPIDSGWITQGPKVREFEQRFASLHQCAHAVAVSSGTAAIQLALVSCGIGPGDDVIVPAFTWVATANAVIAAGARPVLLDVDEATYNLDPARLSSVITDSTRAVIAVHLFGRCAPIEAIRAIAPQVLIVEDAACAAGASTANGSAGALGDVAAFSFHPRKVITTGEGGMLTTNDDAVATRARVLRNHGADTQPRDGVATREDKMPRIVAPGFNFRMSDLHAAMGIIQLGRLEQFIVERRRLADRYRERLRGLPWLRAPAPVREGRHGQQAFVCAVAIDAGITRNGLMEKLERQGIQTRPGTHAVHLLDYYRAHFGFKTEDFPNAAFLDRQSVALPLHNCMSMNDVEFVCDALSEIGHSLAG